jgi:iron(III) transport system substrate-binding protein
MNRMLCRLFAALTAIALGAVAPAAFAQKTQLLVYTALETDQLKAYADSFAKFDPNIELKWVRDSTGVITAKVMAEKANPQADVIMGVAATSMMVFDQEGLLMPYKPKGFEKLTRKYSDSKATPAWVGMDAWGSTVCFNVVEAAKRGIPRPESWEDLTKPIYKGQITMPAPPSSGTGFLDTTAWLQMWGEAKGWKYMDALHENIAQYTHSGSKPCRQAGGGEFVVGISFEYRAQQVKKSGAPIMLIFPKEGLGWDIEASGIVKTTKKQDAAKKLMDWIASREANELYARWWQVVALPGIAQPQPNIPENYEQMLIKNDFTWAAKNRDKILAEWQKRYSAKIEK